MSTSNKQTQAKETLETIGYLIHHNFAGCAEWAQVTRRIKVALSDREGVTLDGLLQVQESLQNLRLEIEDMNGFSLQQRALNQIKAII